MGRPRLLAWAHVSGLHTPIVYLQKGTGLRFIHGQGFGAVWGLFQGTRHSVLGFPDPWALMALSRSGPPGLWSDVIFSYFRFILKTMLFDSEGCVTS
ncbi:uncharacterized protein BJX67DRAFT_326210 [Aspergillus lucknowensis]|uniref:Uncharacterized protein n=1 Tax=Aspergillus lucknowensis TaxID=176173 RepID=A0ABR4LBJ6_9EURO